MTSRRRLAALVLALAGALITGSPTANASAPPLSGAAVSDPVKTVYFDMYYNQRVAPKRIYLTANAGQWMRRLNWDGWGTGKAVAHGTFISDCASCPDPARRGVTLTFTDPVFCKSEGVRTYRKARGVVSVPSEGSTRTHFKVPTGCP